MGRRKLALRYIRRAKTRRTTFEKRKKGLLKKAHELSLLCGEDTCVIMYRRSPSDGPTEPQIWPPDDEQIRRIIQLYTVDWRKKRVTGLAELVGAEVAEAYKADTEFITGLSVEQSKSTLFSLRNGIDRIRKEVKERREMKGIAGPSSHDGIVVLPKVPEPPYMHEALGSSSSPKLHTGTNSWSTRSTLFSLEDGVDLSGKELTKRKEMEGIAGPSSHDGIVVLPKMPEPPYMHEALGSSSSLQPNTGTNSWSTPSTLFSLEDGIDLSGKELTKRKEMEGIAGYSGHDGIAASPMVPEPPYMHKALGSSSSLEPNTGTNSWSTPSTLFSLEDGIDRLRKELTNWKRMEGIAGYSGHDGIAAPPIVLEPLHMQEALFGSSSLQPNTSTNSWSTPSALYGCPCCGCSCSNNVIGQRVALNLSHPSQESVAQHCSPFVHATWLHDLESSSAYCFSNNTSLESSGFGECCDPQEELVPTIWPQMDQNIWQMVQPPLLHPMNQFPLC